MSQFKHLVVTMSKPGTSARIPVQIKELTSYVDISVEKESEILKEMELFPVGSQFRATLEEEHPNFQGKNYLVGATTGLH